MSDRTLTGAFTTARAQGRAALIPFLPAGWPSASVCVDALHLACRGGADVIELGLPFSDPVADGPSIQRASQSALEQGMTVRRALSLVREAALDVPLVLMTYLNPILAYGPERFVDDAAAAGVTGLLCTDLPAGADPSLERILGSGPLEWVRLVAPTTSEHRLRAYLRGERGFIYLISRLGVTGARADAPADLERHVQRIRAVTPLPIAVGFGISSPAQAAVAARCADGVVVGSALVDAIDAGGLPAGERLLSGLTDALRTPEAA